MARTVRSPLDRFMEKVEVDPSTGCWLWTGAIHPLGYGRFWMGERGKSAISAHTAAWLLLRGPIPEGLEPDHLCRVRRCVNVDHLEPVTHQENILRSVQPHCVHGHPFDERNTLRSPAGWRMCRQCNVIRVRAWRQRQKACANGVA